ncbi:hypothetical protein EDD40_0484 [Saccharothrix texasensis]|uniref:Uncharacterized protein n=1 Tax=Saccharothrix texasensis TaxID=103734 RepID=A0A3N1GZ68_9PSEU|nr:hypothetical protein EDD40_0484 [Saccharothrix texasensis]
MRADRVLLPRRPADLAARYDPPPARVDTFRHNELFG